MKRSYYFLLLLALAMTFSIAAQTPQKDDRKVTALPIEGDPDPTPKDRITIQMLKQRMDDQAKVLIIDSRSEGAWEGSAVKIKGAVRIAQDQIEKELKSGMLKAVPKAREIVIYCT
jgi:3-mercaptopyruvate sulfurtransferase SseA